MALNWQDFLNGDTGLVIRNKINNFNKDVVDETADIRNSLGDNDNDISELRDDVDQNTSDISNNTSNISGLDSRISNNSLNIVGLQDDVTEHEGEISGLQSFTSTLRHDVDQNTSDISNNTSNISGLDSRISNNSLNIIGLQDDVTEHEGDIADLDVRITNNETAIQGKEDELGAPQEEGGYLRGRLDGTTFWGNPTISPDVYWGNILGNIELQTDLYTEFYEQSEFTATSSPGKPILLDGNGKIDVSMLDTSTFYYVGTHDPSAGTEYPDTSGQSAGAFWTVDALSNPTNPGDPEEDWYYEYTAGELQGKQITVGDFMVWGTAGWGIMTGEMNPTLYYKLDGSYAITAPFKGGGQQLKNIAPGTEAGDAVEYSQISNFATDFLPRDGSMPMQGDIDMDTGKILNLDDAVDPGDGVPYRQLSSHTTATDNPHSVTKDQVGLGSVDNTSDIDKPISTATQAALDTKEDSLGLGTAGQVLTTNNAVDGKEWKSVLTGYKNLLINGGFDVWQRGETIITVDMEYGADRWFNLSGTIEWEKFTGYQLIGNMLSYSCSGKSYALIGQRIENITNYSGKVMTLSFYLINAVDFPELRIRYKYENGSERYATPTIGADGRTCIATFTMPDDETVGDYFQILIQFAAATAAPDAVVVGKIQLELGDTATNFERRPIALEKSLCQRYYQIQQFSGYRIAATNSSWAWGGQVALTSTMRVSPTIDDSGLTFTDCTKEAVITVRDTCYVRVDTAGNTTRFSVSGLIKLDSEIY